MRSNAGDSFSLDRKARRLLKEEHGARGVRLLQKWFNVYVIVADDGAVITGARRTRRLRRV